MRNRLNESGKTNLHTKQITYKQADTNTQPNTFNTCFVWMRSKWENPTQNVIYT